MSRHDNTSKQSCRINDPKAQFAEYASALSDHIVLSQRDSIKAYLIAALKNDEQPSTLTFAAAKASESCCMSSSSVRSRCCGTDIRGNFL